MAFRPNSGGYGMAACGQQPDRQDGRDTATDTSRGSGDNLFDGMAVFDLQPLLSGHVQSPRINPQLP